MDGTVMQGMKVFEWEKDRKNENETDAINMRIRLQMWFRSSVNGSDLRRSNDLTPFHSWLWRKRMRRLLSYQPLPQRGFRAFRVQTPTRSTERRHGTSNGSRGTFSATSWSDADKDFLAVLEFVHELLIELDSVLVKFSCVQCRDTQRGPHDIRKCPSSKHAVLVDVRHDQPWGRENYFWMIVEVELERPRWERVMYI